MLSSTDAPPQDGSAAQLESLPLKLELLRAALEADVMYCTTRDQHIRAVTRLEQVVHIIRMVG